MATTFTSWTGTAFPYAMETFRVGSTGNYSLTVGGIGGGVGIFVMEGAFAPNATANPSTPLASVLAGTQAPPTIPSIALQAGVQYTVLVVLSSGSGNGTVTIAGGCVEVGAPTGTCSPGANEPPGPPTVPPTLTSIPDQTIAQNGTTGPLAFEVSGGVIAEAIRVSASAADAVLVPDSGLVVVGTGKQRTLSVTAADGRSGSTFITLTATDGYYTVSTSFRLTVSVTRPGPPTDVTAALSGQATVMMMWRHPVSGVSTRYAVTGGTIPGGASLPVWLTADSATSLAVPLPSGTYYLRVYAVGSTAIGLASDEVAITVPDGVTMPGPPVALQLTTHGDGGTTFAWTPSTRGETPASFLVEIGHTLGDSDVGTVTVDPTSSSFTRRLPADARWARVRAAHGGAVSAATQELYLPPTDGRCAGEPGAPVLLPVSVTGRTVTISWLPGTGTGIARYRVELSHGLGLEPFTHWTTATGGTSLILDGDAGAFAIQVVAEGACGNSTPSAQVGFTVGASQ